MNSVYRRDAVAQSTTRYADVAVARWRLRACRSTVSSGLENAPKKFAHTLKRRDLFISSIDGASEVWDHNNTALASLSI
ncbi:hypothetical protein SFRURICE_007260 [Spodoptera frugiperda]|nr:hypothetical protein SFRURICE_007260 [Spodoptera frugiperda]